ncbi:uncharacterized protein VICG_00456 [Vittaforma corneae ATCC 50505]|uniref:Uncharacterized protein n=1 Tax=Vittaforma corneae (strain ATCC 50505) TaxID=993615 RepID=L2GN81_VITCO|nr:uncharacterized protein VICG_00456 [Vittaforma corneae ATCC 50505]ELA42358.1 hypothetical protein VICG_00456 [Vittaforma corneae ATCC 50505]
MRSICNIYTDYTIDAKQRHELITVSDQFIMIIRCCAMVKKKEEEKIKQQYDTWKLLKCCCILIYQGIFGRKITIPNFEASLIPLPIVFSITINTINTLVVLVFGITCRGLEISIFRFIKGFFTRFILINSVYIVFGVTLAITLQIKPDHTFLACNATLIVFAISLAVYCLEIFEPRFTFVIFILTTTRKILESMPPEENTWRKSILKLYVIIVQLVVFKIFRSSIFCDF